MLNVSFMNTSATEIEQRTVSELGPLDVRSPEIKARACEWFSVGVRALKQDAYADRLGITKSVMSEMLSGKRPIYLTQALPMFEDINWAREFIGWQCRQVGFVEPKLEDTVKLSTSEAALLSFLQATPVWGLFLGQLIARKFYHVDIELLEAAIKSSVAK